MQNMGPGPQGATGLGPQRGGGARSKERLDKWLDARTDARIKGDPSQYPEKAAALAFFQGPQDKKLSPGLDNSTGINSTVTRQLLDSYSTAT